MRLRTAKLACLLLLLTSLGAAASSARGAEFSLGGHYVRMILGQTAAVPSTDTPLSRRLAEPAVATPTASVALVRSVWTMRPPSAHSVRVQTVTGSGI